MIKIDLITGFLGSGKTTFLKKYAADRMACGERIGILENDFGAVNVDMMLLQELEEAGCGLEMVSGGCDYDCHRRRFKTKLIAMGMEGYDRVLVEPSGIFNVDEFFDVLCEDPLSSWYEVGNVIAIVDAGLEEDLSEQAEYLLADQIAAAGAVVLSRTQEVPAGQVIKAVDHLNRVMQKYKCDRIFRILTEEDLTDICTKGDKDRNSNRGGDGHAGYARPADGSDVGGMVMACDWKNLTREDFTALSACGWVQADHRRLWTDHAPDFDVISVLHAGLSKERVREGVHRLFEDGSFGNILRVKGFLEDEDGWMELNATAHDLRLSPVTEGQDVVIVIGEHLEKKQIEAFLEQLKK